MDSRDDQASVCSCHGDARGTNRALWDGGGGEQKLTPRQQAPSETGHGPERCTCSLEPLHKAAPRGQAPERTPSPYKAPDPR